MTKPLRVLEIATRRHITCIAEETARRSNGKKEGTSNEHCQSLATSSMKIMLG
jgi:hypothetical protein